jgi:hypothetical protein
MVVEAVLHGLVEQNPPETTLKFIRYTVPNIIQGHTHYHPVVNKKK